MIINLIDKAVASGARLNKSADIMGLSDRTVIRWRQHGGGQDQRKGPLKEPANKLSEQERQQIFDTANCAPFRDLPPKNGVRFRASSVCFLRGCFFPYSSAILLVTDKADLLAFRFYNPTVFLYLFLTSSRGRYFSSSSLNLESPPN
jgi:hypothetical protein